MYAEGDLLALSGIQHLAFCERQWALIHIEGAWQDNQLTAEGTLLHERVDQPAIENRPGVRIARSLPVHSFRLGLSGICDVVEFAGEKCLPIEYKRGKPKKHDADAVQLCAQALCLEEMKGCEIPEGALFYGQTRRRLIIPLNAELRKRTASLAERMHRLMGSLQTPPPVYGKWCSSCSLHDVCLPRSTQTASEASVYLSSELARLRLP